MFLDAVEQRWIEELGGMNIFFVFDDGSMVTPPLGGTILPGITRASLLTLANDKGIKVREDRYSIDQWRADAASGRLREAFACGTAAVVTPIGTVRSNARASSRSATADPGTKTEELKAALVGIQRGRAADPHRLDPQGLLSAEPALEQLAAVRHGLVGHDQHDGAVARRESRASAPRT